MPAFRPLACLLSVPFVLPLAGLRAEESPHGDFFKNQPVPSVVDFNRDVKPFLSEKCYHCHGPDEKARKAKLRLDVRTDAVKERKDGAAIRPKDAEASEVIKRITSTDSDEIMPPPKDGKPLSAREIEILRKWIAQGAPYAEHWAFVKPQRPAPPQVPGLASQNPIDAFIGAKLAENHLQMSPRADMATLVRRIALDLTGLPPTPQEVVTFTKSGTTDPKLQIEQIVDHYLASPAYGERWARMWLDIARYADSAGYGSDPLRLNIWPYRDWVISAFNRNVPYDQFTTEQLAGDLLNNPSEQQLIATAFHRNTMTNTEGGTDREEFRVAAVKDRIAVTAQAWMGLTLGCAQCHSHKFDPISQQDYYSFYAIFNQTEDADRPDDQPTMPLPSDEQRAQMKKLGEEITALEAKLKNAGGNELNKELAGWEKQVQKPVTWTALKPDSVMAGGKAEVEINDDGSFFVLGNNPPKESLKAQFRTELKGITAFRVEALTDDRLPHKGPGRDDTGNGSLSEFRVMASNGPAGTSKGRFVHIELPGKDKILSLAEVQVFSQGKNIAPQGKATQSSSRYEAGAQLAIDGNTDGDFFRSHSVTHTNASDNPWWEVDLGSEKALEKIILWNRTGGSGARLNGALLTVLDAKRKKVFSQTIAKAPETNATYALGGARQVQLVHASADFSQAGFEASRAIDGVKETGWAFGGEIGKPHAIVFETAQPVGDGGDTHLEIGIDQGAVERHNLGRIRVLAATQPLPIAELPAPIKAIFAKAPEARTAAERNQLLAWYKPYSKLLATTQSELTAKRAALAAIKPFGLPVMRQVALEKRRVTHLLSKGNFLDPGVEVQPALLSSFPKPLGTEQPTRLTVAKWLMSRDNPLTARVMVNRLWAQLFGIGIVETEEDFGTQGMLPTHPKLLDWLAVEFMENGWNIKALLKTIVTSETYQQSSTIPAGTNANAQAADPRNLLLWHYPRRRLDADQVRDQALELSGLLSHKIGGASVYPPQPDGLWRAAFNGQRSWTTSKGEDRYRRGLYTFWRRTVPYPSMATFDAPSRENTTLRRVPTNTPLQAFVTLNDPAYFEMSQALGARLIREGGDNVRSRIRFGLELCLGRPATDEQVSALEQLYQEEVQTYKANPEGAKKLSTSDSLPKDKMFPKDSDPAELAAWVEVANVLLNLDGVLTKS